MECNRHNYLNRLVERKQNGLIRVITGARRSGKSYLLNEIFYRYLLNNGVSSSHIIRFAFDSDEDIDLLDEYYPNEETRVKLDKFNTVINAKKFRAYIKDNTDDEGEYFLLLDEVQLLDNFIGTLNSFLRHRNFDVYATGSNSKFLSSDIATEFKGRSSIVHVLPLTFNEYMENFDGSVEDAWKEYVVTGGIPLVAGMNTDEEKMSYLQMLCKETYVNYQSLK